MLLDALRRDEVSNERRRCCMKRERTMFKREVSLVVLILCPRRLLHVSLSVAFACAKILVRSEMYARD